MMLQNGVECSTLSSRSTELQYRPGLSMYCTRRNIPEMADNSTSTVHCNCRLGTYNYAACKQNECIVTGVFSSMDLSSVKKKA